MNVYVLAGLIIARILIFASPVLAQTVDKLSEAVALLKTTRTDTVSVRGVLYEVWLKEPKTGVLTPRTTDLQASAFFVSTSNTAYIVTACHVAAHTTPKTQMYIKGPNDIPLSCVLEDVSLISRGIGWQSHTNADVSVLPLLPTSPFFRDHLSGRFLPLHVFCSESVAPQRDTPIRIIGFPLGLGIGRRFSPLSKVSNVSSGLMTIPLADTAQPADMFLLEDPSIGGYSGAPAFDTGEPIIRSGVMTMRTIGTFSCVGIVHGTLSDQTGGKLAAITPSATLVDLIKIVEQSIRTKASN